MAWSFETPRGYALTVERRADGRWVVVLGGFSRAADPNLRVAMAEASGEVQDADWIAAIVDAVERDEASRA